jgi:YggT family protein
VLLADAVDTAQSFVNSVFLVYFACILAYILLSWIRLPYNVWLNRLQRFLYDVVNPYISLFRRFLPMLRIGAAGLDLSPIVAIVVLVILNRIIQSALELLH